MSEGLEGAAPNGMMVSRGSGEGFGGDAMRKWGAEMNRGVRWIAGAWLAGLVALLSNGCTGGGDGGTLSAQVGGSCMQCHNGSLGGNYSGPGIENPHPFPGAENISCSGCHGGNPAGDDKESSHVPPPPQIGGRALQATNAFAFFNNLTLTGIDKLPNYQSGGKTYAIDPRGGGMVRPAEQVQASSGGGITVSFAGANFYGSPPDRWAESILDQAMKMKRGQL